MKVWSERLFNSLRLSTPLVKMSVIVNVIVTWYRVTLVLF